MEWDAIAAIGEAVGAVGVVISLIYLALQVRANTRESIQNMVQDTIKDFSKVEQLIAASPDLASIVVKGNEGIENLTPDQRLRFDGYCSATFSVLEVWHTQSRRISADPEQYETMLAILNLRLSARGCRQWWRENRNEFPSGFRDWVEESADLK